MKKILALLLFLFFPIVSFAQIEIIEKVEIDPQNFIVGNDPINFPDSTYENPRNNLKQENLPYGPASTIFLSKPGKVKVTVIFSEAAGTAKIDLLMRQPEQQTIKEYANQDIGFSWVSEEYPPYTNVELGIYWYYNSWGTIYQGNEFGAIKTDLGCNEFNHQEYKIGFEAAGDDRDYNELVILVEIIEDPNIFVSIYPGELTTGDIGFLNINLGMYCIPPETKINLEIIKGQEYGSLIDPYTNERSKILANLDHWSGSLNLIYISDGISPEESDSVIIRVNTTDPEIVPKETLLIIKPPPIYAYIVPEVLGADDTADVIIKHRLEDGTLEDFPTEQTFELAVLDGCVNGNFMVDDSINVYFADATQPIKFVTADSLDNEVGKVLIRVGTDLSGFMRPVGNIKGEEGKQFSEKEKGLDKLQAGFEKMIEERRAKMLAGKKEGEGTPPIEAPIVEACYPFDPNKEYNWQGFTSVGDECDSSPCQLGFKEYQGSIGIQEVRENYNNIDYCSFSLAHFYPPAAGIFKPLYDEEFPNSISEKIKDQLLVDFNLDACYDNNNGFWKYGVLEDSIFLRAILDVCEDNILSGPSEYIIHNLAELLIIPDEEVCLALENYEDQRLYGGGGKYYLIAPVWAHEKVHKANFEKVISEVLNMKRDYFGQSYRYKDLLSNVLQPECNAINSDKNKALFQIKKYLDDILNSFIIKIKEQYDLVKVNNDNETTVQNHADVQWKITEYKKELQNNRPKELWKDCPYKEEDN